MAARGFRNDNTSMPPRASAGPCLNNEITQVLKSGGKIRDLYDSANGVPGLKEFENHPGLDTASFILAIVRKAYPNHELPITPNLTPSNIFRGMVYELIPNSGSTSTEPSFRSYPEQPTDPLSHGI